MPRRAVLAWIRAAYPLRPSLARSQQGGGFRGGFQPPPMPDITGIAFEPKAPPAPAGCKWYETTLLLRPDATEAEREAEVDKIGAFLEEHEAQELDIVAHEAQATAYSVGGHSHAAYVYLNYAARPAAVDALHKMFATPTVGSEPVLLRFMTLLRK